MKVGIIGGGLMGICIGYFLSQRGVSVEIFEASPNPGGLAGAITLEDGTQVDRFYHAILSSDRHLHALCSELGIADQLRFRDTGMGFFYKGQIHSMNTVLEFLRFPPLGWVDRFRLGFTILYAQFIRDWQKLENISVEKWLVGLSGQRTYKNIWLPMLKAKFDGNFDQTPATYIWSRLVRMKSTRSGANQKEQAGHLIGGYTTLIQAMIERVKAAGGKLHLGKPVNKIIIENNQAFGIQVKDEIHTFDKFVSTLPSPIFQQLISDSNSEYRQFLAQTQYLGIVCPLLVLNRPLSGYWTLNLTDDNLPFTGVIETTSYIDSKFVNGYHLVYLPKYTAPNNPLQKMADEEINALWIKHLKDIFPHFDQKWIRYFLIHRERYVEPLHLLSGTNLIPSIQTPIENLFLATNAQIYPALTNGESICQKAREISLMVIGDKQ